MTAGLPYYNEVVLDTPVIISPAVIATAEPIFKNPYKWVTSFVIRVRSMGTATFIGVGNQTAQLYRLVSDGQVYQYSCNPGEVINASTLWIVSDQTDPVLEVVCSYLPIAQYGNVNLSIGQR